MLIGLLLLALLIPLACSALRGSGPGGGAGNNEAEQQGAAGETTSQEAQGGASTTAPGRTTGDAASAAGGNTTVSGGGEPAASGGGTTGGEIAGVPPAGAVAAAGASLETGGQQSGDGTTVTVPRAEITGVDGWLAIHTDDNVQPGEVIGYAPLREGGNTDVAVRLDKPAPSGRPCVMAHADDPDDDRYTPSPTAIRPSRWTARSSWSPSSTRPPVSRPAAICWRPAVRR